MKKVVLAFCLAITLVACGCESHISTSDSKSYLPTDATEVKDLGNGSKRPEKKTEKNQPPKNYEQRTYSPVIAERTDAFSASIWLS